MPKILKKLITLGIILIVVLFTIDVIKKRFAKKPVQEAPPKPVRIATAIQKDVPVYIETFGNLTAYDNVDIMPQVTGKVLKVHFKQGQKVNVGDPLFTIDPRPFIAQLDKAKAALAQDMAELKLKEDTLKRNRVLFEKNLISKQEFENYQTDVASAKAMIQNDLAEIRLARINLTYCHITSPIVGITGKRLVDVGNIVKANDNPVLLNIRTIDPLYIDFTATEHYLPAIRENMAKNTLSLIITITEDKHSPYTGKLQLIDNSVDNTTGTIALRAHISNKEGYLWPGQFVKIHLILYTLKNAVLVPEIAARLGQDGKFIFIVGPDNIVELREDIKLGQLQENDEIVILSGVKPGEKVVTYGQLGLRDKTKVTILPDEDDPNILPTSDSNITDTIAGDDDNNKSGAKINFKDTPNQEMQILKYNK